MAVAVAVPTYEQVIDLVWERPSQEYPSGISPYPGLLPAKVDSLPLSRYRFEGRVPGVGRLVLITVAEIARREQIGGEPQVRELRGPMHVVPLRMTSPIDSRTGCTVRVTEKWPSPFRTKEGEILGNPVSPTLMHRRYTRCPDRRVGLAESHPSISYTTGCNKDRVYGTQNTVSDGVMPYAVGSRAEWSGLSYEYDIEHLILPFTTESRYTPKVYTEDELRGFQMRIICNAPEPIKPVTSYAPRGWQRRIGKLCRPGVSFLSCKKELIEWLWQRNCPDAEYRAEVRAWYHHWSNLVWVWPERAPVAETARVGWEEPAPLTARLLKEIGRPLESASCQLRPILYSRAEVKAFLGKNKGVPHCRYCERLLTPDYLSEVPLFMYAEWLMDAFLKCGGWPCGDVWMVNKRVATKLWPVPPTAGKIVRDYLRFQAYAFEHLHGPSPFQDPDVWAKAHCDLNKTQMSGVLSYDLMLEQRGDHQQSRMDADSQIETAALDLLPETSDPDALGLEDRGGFELVTDVGEELAENPPRTPQQLEAARIYRMARIEKMKLRVVAEMIGCSPSTVQRQLRQLDCEVKIRRALHQKQCARKLLK